VNEPVLSLRNVSKAFTLHAQEQRVEGCRDVTFDLAPGEFVGITGRSGSGKSTVLKLIYRTYLPQAGEMRYASEAFGSIDLARADERTVLALRRQEIGYVSQFLRVVPRTTAREVVESAMRETGTDPSAARAEAERLLEHFELPKALWESFPQTFSGGEKLRVNVARAMIKRPRILLLDEPTASLDAHSKSKVRALLASLKTEGTTMLGIFHDLAFMEGVCDRELHMEAGILS